MNADEIIKKLELQPHPEGGYFKETYRSSEIIDVESLPKRYSGNRAFSTQIFFLLKGNQFSTFHKLNSDETWHFHLGCSVEIISISPDGTLTRTILGINLYDEQLPQHTIPAGVWFAAKPLELLSYTLVSCSVAPGFDFTDFELGDKDLLKKQFPWHSQLIDQFTR